MQEKICAGEARRRKKKELLACLGMEGAVGDPADYCTIFPHNCNAAVPPVKDQPRDVLLWHIRKLLAENIFQRK